MQHFTNYVEPPATFYKELWDRSSYEVDPHEVIPYCCWLLKENRFIATIKVIRTNFKGTGIKDAKHFAEALGAAVDAGEVDAQEWLRRARELPSYP